VGRVGEIKNEGVLVFLRPVKEDNTMEGIRKEGRRTSLLRKERISERLKKASVKEKRGILHLYGGKKKSHRGERVGGKRGVFFVPAGKKGGEGTSSCNLSII